jgi:photosystem II stability/assembly factor-like uncharacterized protein
MRIIKLKEARKFCATALAGCCGLITLIPAALAQNWLPANTPSLDWLSVASSADGSRLVAGGYYALYTSTNAGADWTSNNVPSHVWTCVASSADGNLLAAAVGYPDKGGIYFSTNGGDTWTPSASAPTLQWASMAMSGDGTKIMAVPAAPSPLYMSTDSGATWTTNAFPGGALSGVAASANGNQWVVIQRNGGVVFVSTNIGASWASNNVGTPFFDVPSLATSADGNTLVAGAGGNGGLIYTSTNSGLAWTTNTVRKVWASAAASADGRRLIAGSYPAIYTSTDSGATWISNNAPTLSWRAVASSADGSALVAVAFPGVIYTLKTTTMPSLKIQLMTPNSNAGLSWIIPSTDCVLQQSSDLASWSDVTNVPTLNFTNLENQVSMPPTNGSCFYRLVTP